MNNPEAVKINPTHGPLIERGRFTREVLSADDPVFSATKPSSWRQ